MKIWIINFNANQPSVGGLNRHYYFKKYLEQRGHQVTIFTNSSIFNRNKNFFAPHEKGDFKRIKEDGEEFIYVKSKNSGNTIKRLIYIHSFCKRLKKILNSHIFEKPDIIYASLSPELETGRFAVKYAKKINVPVVIETRDIYPETLSSMHVIKENSLLFKMTKSYVRKTFYNADALFFTMDGGKDYIKDSKWDLSNKGKIDLDNVYTIHNGVDIDFFNNQINNEYKDEDLDNKEYRNIVYAGSIGQANDLDRLLDIAKCIKDHKYRFLIWGDGKLKDHICQRIKDEHIDNVKYKGVVEGQLVPSILSKAYLNIFILKNDFDVLKYGTSSNKSFQYLASKKPIMVLFDCRFDILERIRCGLHVRTNDFNETIKEINEFLSSIDKEYDSLCLNTEKAIKEIDYKEISIGLEDKLNKIINQYKK